MKIVVLNEGSSDSRVSASPETVKKISQIKIPAGSTISLKDLNLHLMFLDYDSNIEWFEPHKAKLYFSNNMKLEVEFDLDANGILNISASEKSAGKKELRIQSNKNNLIVFK